MTQTAESPSATLRSRMRGDVVDASDLAYDEARKVWNADIDRRPLVIARCLDEADVQAAVMFATEQGLEIAVRCGAHAMSGTSVVDDGIVIDLGAMNQVRVDPDARRAVVAGGALLGDTILLGGKTRDHSRILAELAHRLFLVDVGVHVWQPCERVCIERA